MSPAKANKFKILWLLPVVAISASFLVPSSVSSQPQLLLSGTPGQERYKNADLLAQFYNEHGMRLIWVRGIGSFQPRIEAVLKILNESWTHGLNPEHYKVTEISSLLPSLNAGNKMELEFMISDAVIRYMDDLSSMRGQRMSADSKLKFWREPVAKETILPSLAAAHDPVAKMRAVEPVTTLYQVLRKELMHLAAQPVQDTAPVAIKGALKPGKTYAQIPAIREKMGMPPRESNPEMYDEALAVEVMSLQRSHGLDTNGVIDAATLAHINVTNEDRMMQIIANMERLRWMEQDRPDRYVLVNIPSANLWAVEGGEVKLDMPVIIGKTARPTYSFKTEITGVRFNPNWTVPPTIKNEDFLPALQSNPNLLNERGIIIKYKGQVVDPLKVDWSTVTKRDLAQVRMIQAPGDDNPLGKVRVIMENPYNIYLHDTNHREMFDKKERELSSGCVRVSQPEKLADFIMGRNEGWDETRTAKLIGSGKMRDIKTDAPIPVYITYQTVWLGTDGRIVYGRDVYGQDRKLIEILQKSGSIHIPKRAETKEISL